MCKVSIIVPTYNVAPYITECMDSLINQTLEDIEIICVDAFSTDGTREVLEAYAAKDRRVQILDDIKRSTGYAKNIGIQAASGEYVGIVESDDYVALDTYKELYSCADQYHTDIVKGNYQAFTGTGEERMYALKAISLYKEDYNQIIHMQEDNRYFNWDMYTWTGIYKKSFLEEFEICHNESPGASFQDVGFWLQTIASARTAYLLPGYYYNYRRDNPYSSVHQSNKVYEMIREYEYGMKRIGEQALQNILPGIYSGMYRSYAFVYGTLEDKYRQEFAEHFHQDMKHAAECHRIDRRLFTEDEWNGLKAVIDSAEGYQEYYRNIEKCKKKNQEELLEIIEQYSENIIFGAGSDGSNLQAFLKTRHKDKTMAFSDNAVEKWGRKINGIKIIEPKKIRTEYPEALVIVTSRLYAQEIQAQLLENGWKKESIYICDVGMTIPQYL